VEEYLERRGRDEYHCIIVEHGALMEYERNIFWFMEKLCFHNQSLLLMFLSYFHY
jgi:hypothetical protein